MNSNKIVPIQVKSNNQYDRKGVNSCYGAAFRAFATAFLDADGIILNQIRDNIEKGHVKDLEIFINYAIHYLKIPVTENMNLKEKWSRLRLSLPPYEKSSPDKIIEAIAKAFYDTTSHLISGDDKCTQKTSKGDDKPTLNNKETKVEALQPTHYDLTLHGVKKEFEQYCRERGKTGSYKAKQTDSFFLMQREGFRAYYYDGLEEALKGSNISIKEGEPLSPELIEKIIQYGLQELNEYWKPSVDKEYGNGYEDFKKLWKLYCHWNVSWNYIPTESELLPLAQLFNIDLEVTSPIYTQSTFLYSAHGEINVNELKLAPHQINRLVDSKIVQAPLVEGQKTLVLLPQSSDVITRRLDEAKFSELEKTQFLALWDKSYHACPTISLVRKDSHWESVVKRDLALDQNIAKEIAADDLPSVKCRPSGMVQRRLYYFTYELNPDSVAVYPTQQFARPTAEEVAARQKGDVHVATQLQFLYAQHRKLGIDKMFDYCNQVSKVNNTSSTGTVLDHKEDRSKEDRADSKRIGR